VQDQPVVSVAAEGLRHDPLELGFDLIDCFPRREAGSVRDPEDVRVDRERLLAERRVENDVGRLPANAGQRLQLFTRPRDFAVMSLDQSLAEGDDILRLGIEQADRLDRLAQPILAEGDHLLRRLDALKDGPGRDVDTGVRRLRRKNDGDEQWIGIRRLELGHRCGVLLRQPPEELEDVVALHSCSMTSRIE
jgi:hypothetical protein